MKAKISIENYILVLIILISAIMHLPHFQKDLMGNHVWRQSYNQSTIDNFFEEDMNILNPRCNDRGTGDGIRRIEFPLAQWMVASCYFIVGSNIWVTRCIFFLIGVFSIIGMYSLAFNISNNRILALISAFCMAFSPMFFYYMINPMSDDLSLCTGIWGLSFFYQFANSKSYKSLIISSLLLSISVLCKLPFVIYYWVPFMYFITNWKKNSYNKPVSILFYSSLIFPIIWYGWSFMKWSDAKIMSGPFNSDLPFLKTFYFIKHTFFSFFIEEIIGFGSLILFILGMYFLIKNRKKLSQNIILLLSLAIPFLLYYLYEVNAIADIHNYYLFPIYPLIFFIIGYGGMSLTQLNLRYYKILYILIVFFILLACFLRTQNSWNPNKPDFNRDFLIYKNELRRAVPDNALVLVGSDISHSIFYYYTHKKGWCFESYNINMDDLKQYINSGLQYVYSDSKELNENPEFIKLMNPSFKSFGSINVYKVLPNESK